MSKASLVRLPNGDFRAFDEDDQKALRNIAEGECITVKWDRERSIMQNRYYRKMLQEVYNNLPDVFANRYPTTDHFHTELKVLAGEFETFFSMNDGKEYRKVKSTSFDKMSQEEFTRYVASFKNLVHEYFIEGFNFSSLDRHFEKFYSRILE